jgi:TldD protein
MLKKELIEDVLNTLLESDSDFAEVFVEDKYQTNISLQDTDIQSASSTQFGGVGLRLAKGYKRVYAYTNDFSRDSLLSLAYDLSQSFPGERQLGVVQLEELEQDRDHEIKINPKVVELEAKVELLKKADQAARDYNESIVQASVSYQDYVQNVWIANSKGRYVNDERIRTRFFVSAIASDGTKKESGYSGPGGLYGFEYYTDIIDVEDVAREAARVAVTMLHADEAPSGKMPVVIDNGFGGVIFHEAFGHSLEATAVAKGASVFTGRKGEVVASTLVSAVDDGTIPNAWGSATYDDEGNKQTRRQLLKNGVLTSYMIDDLNAIRMNDKSTNSGRRQSFEFSPTSRMTNTYIENGDSTFDEIIAATQYGLYAKRLGGGSVNPATGDFNFSVSEAYMIRDGKIAEPVRGASLVGTGPKALMEVDMVGDNLYREQGMCGSESGSIPVDVGQPTIRVKEITVGGRGGKA